MKSRIDSWCIIPTGSEILQGVVTDTNTPEIFQLILQHYPAHKLCRFSPVPDLEDEIIAKIKKAVKEDYKIIILMGGSGGGKEYVDSFNPDQTHAAIINYIKEAEGEYNYIEIYGSNNHLFSKIVFAKIKDTKIINIPGPYQEAVAATAEITKRIEDVKSYNYEVILNSIAESIINTFPEHNTYFEEAEKNEDQTGIH